MECCERGSRYTNKVRKHAGGSPPEPRGHTYSYYTRPGASVLLVKPPIIAAGHRSDGGYNGNAPEILYDATYEPNPGYAPPGYSAGHKTGSRKSRSVAEDFWRPLGPIPTEATFADAGYGGRDYGVYRSKQRSIGPKLTHHGYGFDARKKFDFGLGGQPYLKGAEKGSFTGRGGYGSFDHSDLFSMPRFFYELPYVIGCVPGAV